MRPAAMVQPKPAAVRPRVVCPHSGETVPLENVVRELLDRGRPQRICLWGPAGSGTTTALEHLAAVLPAGAKVHLVDADAPPQLPPNEALLVYTAKVRRPANEVPPDNVYRLAPWGTDDALEYLLARHRHRCASVMERLQAATDLDVLTGLAELWCIVLDAMAADDSLRDANSALKAHLNRQLADPRLRSLAQTYCLTSLKGSESIPPKYAERWRAGGGDDDVLRALRHRPLQVLLAAERVVADLKRRERCDYLTGRVPRALIRECAQQLAGERTAVSHLHRLARKDPARQPVAVSILHATPGGWKPTGKRARNLSWAYLDHAQWPRVRLAMAELTGVDLSHADLTFALLDRSCAETAHFQHARLRSASLEHLRAAGADFSQADLSKVNAQYADFTAAKFVSAKCEAASLCWATFHNADLSGASFARADLTRASLVGAEFDGTDFSAANLRRAVLARLSLSGADFVGACFVEADLRWADLECLELPGALFEEANLEEALLTGSILPNANFTGANLRSAGLADVEWEGASLRDADLRGATFHMGSARSGLVGSPIASEGSRTGFYTDDYEEQHYKAPEEIRKANLCGADLRGALIDDVDFYLVDLRGARYDADQEAHFRYCGAILDRQNR